jgi:hypothetical protein
MKEIGRTKEGNYLLEASENEYLMLVHLASSLEGKPIDEIRYHKEPSLETDFYGVFGAIEAFALAHYRVNDLQILLDRLKNKLMEGGSKDV